MPIEAVDEVEESTVASLTEGPTDTRAAAPSARRRARASTPAAAGSRPIPTIDSGQRSTATTPFEAMEAEELARTRVFAVMSLGVAAGVGVALTFAGGHPIAKLIVVGAMAVMVAAVVDYLRVTRDPARFTVPRMIVTGIPGFVTILAGIHFWGVVSPGTAVMLFGIYFFSLGSRAPVAHGLYALGAGGHLVLAILIMTGAIPELAVIRSTEMMSIRDQIASQIVIQIVYFAAHMFGRRSRRVTFEAVARLEQAVRAVSVREALLAEARQELDRQLKIGGPGRYTEQVVGSYRLGNLLGRGGMGEVYEARNVHDGRDAAVKLLHPASLGDETALGRFLREAQIAAKLKSPHVAAVLEVGTTAGEVPFIAMEKLRGEDLGRQLRRVRRMAPADVVAIVRQIAAALGEAHAAGVIHRDLKPSNLFMHDAGGGPMWKVLDFGVSKVPGHGGTLTAGRVVGTPGYMSPEQARGEDVDRRGDTFSLAAIAYRCLTGHPPFTGKDAPTTLYEVVTKMPTQPSLLAPLSHDVDRALALGLTKDRRERFPDAAAFADALAAAVGEKLPDDLRRLGDARMELNPWGLRVT